MNNCNALLSKYSLIFIYQELYINKKSINNNKLIHILQNKLTGLINIYIRMRIYYNMWGYK